MSDATTGGSSGRYRFDSRIATGGMGEVWRATDQVLGREVAVKLLKTEYADDPTFRSRFETEARNAAALHHANAASVFDFGELAAGEGPNGGAERPFLVMELVRGEPLSALLRGDEPMPPESAVHLVAQAADALAAAHDLGIVHRDVKPANLLVTPDRTVKITDFGIARAADAVALTRTGQVIGTPQYLSPEQAEGKTSTGASDIYSLGVVLYECLAGRRPFDGDSPIATALAHLREPPPPLPDEVPAWLREVVDVALAKDPAERFASVRDFASALRGGPIHSGTAAGPVSDDAPTRVQTAAPVAGAVAGGAVAGAAAGAGYDDGGYDDGGYDDGGTRVIAPPPDRDDERSRRRRPGWLPWLAAAAAVAVIVVALVWLSGRAQDEDTPNDPGTGTASPSAKASSKPSRTASQTPTKTPTRTPTETATPDQVVVNEGDYVGRPASDAKADLEALGLKVKERKVDNPGDKEKDTVAAVSPTGEVDPGSTITLSVYDNPPPVKSPTLPDTGLGSGNGNGIENGSSNEKGKNQ